MYPVPAASNRFAVDYVEPETRILATMAQGKALERKANRRVLLASAESQPVVAECAGINSLIGALHLAFKYHLPIALSPDTIWLTLAQGFAHHIAEQPEEFRSRLVRHSGKETLDQAISGVTLEDLQIAMEGFSQQIRDRTEPAVHDALICDFTTTTPEARTASEIVLMDTYSPFFEYTLTMFVCGIPSITLAGTVQDWQKIRERVEVFATFKLEWWVRHLRPILDEFVAAAAGQPNREFWRGIYKFQEGIGRYSVDKVTGWVTTLFPYWGDERPRHRNTTLAKKQQQEVALGLFPIGLCSVPVKLKKVLPGIGLVSTTELNFMAGIGGVMQNPADGTLSPGISWCVAVPPGPTPDTPSREP